MNLFQLASDNTDQLRQQLDDLRRGHEGDQAAIDRMEDFQEQVRGSGRVGVNMRLFVVASVLRDGAYLNTYEVAANKAAASGRTLDDILREQLGAYHDKRLAVDKMGPDEAEEVRICRQTQTHLQALVAKQFIGGLDDTEKAQLLDFQTLLAELGTRSLTLTEATTC